MALSPSLLMPDGEDWLCLQGAGEEEGSQSCRVLINNGAVTATGAARWQRVAAGCPGRPFQPLRPCAPDAPPASCSSLRSAGTGNSIVAVTSSGLLCQELKISENAGDVGTSFLSLQLLPEVSVPAAPWGPAPRSAGPPATA